MNKIIALFPINFTDRIALLAALQNHILQEELQNARNDHRTRELASAQRTSQIQSKNSELAAENKRLRDELSKLDLIRISVRDITTSHDPSSTYNIPTPTQATASPGGKNDYLDTVIYNGTTASPGGGDVGLSFSELSRVPNSPPQQHGDLLAQLDRNITRASRSPAVSYNSNKTYENRSYNNTIATTSTSTTDSPRSIASGKAFFRECRHRLDKASFTLFIADIRGLKVNAITREEVFQKASTMFGDDNKDLSNQLRGLLYTI